jgi:hypothetical protein
MKTKFLGISCENDKEFIFLRGEYVVFGCWAKVHVK